MNKIFALFLAGFFFSSSHADKPENKDSLAYAIKHYQVDLVDMPHLQRIERYLTGLTSIKSDFIQVAPSGDVTTGKFYLQRPGKLRMEYDPPTPILLVTNGSSLVYFDKELKQVTTIPLTGTLIGFLARKEVTFDSSVKIVNFTRKPGSLRVTLVEADHPRDGLLTLEFSDGPLKLRNMVVTDAGGQITTVSLNNARYGEALDPGLFVFHDPRSKYSNVPH